MRTVARLLAIVLFSALTASGGECPKELLSAVELHRSGLSAAQNLIKASTFEKPLGIEPTQAFDLANHNCHQVPGQAYRIYSDYSCKMEDSGKKAVVRFPYRLFYRRSETVEGVFAEEWKEGTDGILQVTFETDKNGWSPAETRETLDLGGSGKSHEAKPPKK